MNSVSGGFARAASFHVPALGGPALTAVLGRARVEVGVEGWLSVSVVGGLGGDGKFEQVEGQH